MSDLKLCDGSAGNRAIDEKSNNLNGRPGFQFWPICVCQQDGVFMAFLFEALGSRLQST